jgi:hypothetical protein
MSSSNDNSIPNSQETAVATKTSSRDYEPYSVIGQSTKQAYAKDIETSRKIPTIYKSFEYFEDYSHSTSNVIGCSVGTDKYDTPYQALFQPDGPKVQETMGKLLEWRKSGDSVEIGHQGGGNSRTLYGFDSDKVHICMKIDENNILYSSTRPNDLHQLALSDMEEHEFRRRSDLPPYINSPVHMSPKDMPAWYKNTYDKLKKESGIEPKYLIYFELKDIPKEYVEQKCWNQYINQIRAKQFDIPIWFKNDFLTPRGSRKAEERNGYIRYHNIDMVGLHDSNKVNDKYYKLYYHEKKNEYYIKSDDRPFINVKNEKVIKLSEDMSYICDIRAFIADKEYIDTELKKYNKDINNKLSAESFYGVYIILNGKLTNYKPVEGQLLGQSKNNKINNGKNSAYFRVIFMPKCKDELLYKFIQTREIKALTGFLPQGPYEDVLALITTLFKDKFVQKQKQTIKESSQGTEDIGLLKPEKPKTKPRRRYKEELLQKDTELQTTKASFEQQLVAAYAERDDALALAAALKEQLLENGIKPNV